MRQKSSHAEIATRSYCGHIYAAKGLDSQEDRTRGEEKASGAGGNH